MTSHAIVLPIEDWHRTQADIAELADAYLALHGDVLWLLMNLEDRGVVDGFVHERVSDIISDSRRRMDVTEAMKGW